MAQAGTQGNIRLSQAHWGAGLPNHSPQGLNGGGVFAEEWNLCSTAQYLLPLFVFDERVIELSGLPGYQRDGPEARTPQYGFWKTGGFRLRFILECIADLRKSLIDRGSDLLLRFGKTETVLDQLIGSLTAQGDAVEAVWMQKEAASDDVDIEKAIAKTVLMHQVLLHFSYGKTLIHPADLPFGIKETPDVFTPYRKRIESLGKRMVRCTVEPPEQFKPFPPVQDVGNYSFEINIHDPDVHDEDRARTDYSVSSHQLEEIDTTKSSPQHDGSYTWNDLLRFLLHPVIQPQHCEALNDHSQSVPRHPASAFPFTGGELPALERLKRYFVQGRLPTGPANTVPVTRYKQTRNNLLGSGYSTKMSPYLAYGCISPRQIWCALDDVEARLSQEKEPPDQSTYWVRYELFWRDFFQACSAKFGELLFALGGFETITDPRQAEKKLRTLGWWKQWDHTQNDDGDQSAVTRLLEGRTGIPFIDAQLVELRTTGFLSNRGRQNVASFLAKDLCCDWRVGAELFASQLIDYDPTSNYGNWYVCYRLTGLCALCLLKF